MKLLPNMSSEQLLKLYTTMLTIRRSEEQLVKASQAGTIIGPCHTYIGEEAVATGVCAHLGDQDKIFSTHRGHGHSLAKGVTPRELIAELYARETGCSGGRGGSMHLFKPEVGLLGTSGIVGPSITLAAGAALSAKLHGTDQVSAAFFGDGASNNGSFHEGINLATAWELPVLFVCENNLYATEVAFSRASKSPSVSARAAGYGLPGVQVDGNDVLAVYQAAGEAVDRARAGQGPTLLECMTYRLRPHAEGMRDVGYRTKEEIAEWRTRCPIKRLGEALMSQGSVTQQQLDEADAQVRATVADAHEFALGSPWPDPETVMDHLFS